MKIVAVLFVIAALVVISPYGYTAEPSNKGSAASTKKTSNNNKKTTVNSTKKKLKN